MVGSFVAIGPACVLSPADARRWLTQLFGDHPPKLPARGRQLLINRPLGGLFRVTVVPGNRLYQIEPVKVAVEDE